MSIDYNIFNQFFSPDEWDIGYLFGKEIYEVLNQPIKLHNQVDNIKLNGASFDDTTIFLVVVKHSYDFDYSLNIEFNKILVENQIKLNYEIFECNYKYAAVKAGLGQYARNSLFHHPRYDFDLHLAVYLIRDNIYNLPSRNLENFNLLDSCNNCYDCIHACPAQAIHINSQGRTWIDLQACDNFCHFGNHGKIPSIKWNLVKINNINLTDQEIWDIHNFQDWQKAIGPQGEFLKLNNENSCVIFPICRECTSQKRCTKYNGKYPYDWNRVIIREKQI